MMGAARELAIGGQAVWLASRPRLSTSFLVAVRAIGNRTGTSRSGIRVFPRTWDERGRPRESCRIANSLHWSELDALAGPVSCAVGFHPHGRCLLIVFAAVVSLLARQVRAVATAAGQSGHEPVPAGAAGV